MTKHFLFLLIGLLLSAHSLSAQENSMRLATYNIRYDNKADTVNAWKKRLPAISSQIRFHDFDIFGTQEVMPHQLKDMAEVLPAYAYLGVGRDDGKEKGEFAAIFYKKERFELLNEGHFWLSETPNKPGKGWDADYPRVCSWGEFRDKETDFRFYFFNIHFDHRGQTARKESVSLIQQKMKEIAGDSPLILLGDFNFTQYDPLYGTLASTKNLRDAYTLAEHPYALRGTFNAFEAERQSNERIDHIWLSRHFEVVRYGILTDTYANGLFPSDHFPVMAELGF